MEKIKIVDHDLWRAGKKIGWIEGNHLRAHDGTKLGYFDSEHVYNAEGRRLAYVEGDYLYTEGGDSKVPLETVSEEIEGGVEQGIDKCAIYVLLGD